MTDGVRSSRVYMNSLSGCQTLSLPSLSSATASILAQVSLSMWLAQSPVMPFRISTLDRPANAVNDPFGRGGPNTTWQWGPVAGW